MFALLFATSLVAPVSVGSSQLDTRAFELVSVTGAAASSAESAETPPARSGRLRSLSGEPHELDAHDPHAAVAFVRSRASELGLPSDLELEFTRRGSKTGRLEGRFVLDGEPVLGLRVDLQLDALERVVEVHARGFAGARRLGEHTLADARAVELALASAGAPNELVGAPRRAWRSTADGLLPVIRVIVRVAQPHDEIEIELDARDELIGGGRIVGSRSLVRHGLGVYPFFVDDVGFPTGKAKVSAYKNVAASLTDSDKMFSLSNWSLGVPAPADLARGPLVAAHVDSTDATGANAFALDGKFLADAQDAAAARVFDQTNAAYQVERTYLALKKRLGSVPSLNYALPVISGVGFNQTPFANFTESLLDGGRVQGGIFLGKDGEARDTTVIAHEYVHAWLFREGQSFDNNLLQPFRAIEEGLCDWLGTSLHKRAVFGERIELDFGPGLRRELEGDETFESAIDAAFDAGISGMPSALPVATLVGQMLRDCELVLGAKTTTRLVERTLSAVPKNLTDAGVTNYSSNNAEDVFLDVLSDFFLEFLREHQEDGGKHYGKLLGRFAARGLAPSITFAEPIPLLELPKGRLRIEGETLDSASAHVFFCSAPVGLRVRCRVSTTDPAVIQAFVGESGFATESSEFSPDNRSHEVVLVAEPLSAPQIRSLSVFVIGGGTPPYEFEIEVLD